MNDKNQVPQAAQNVVELDFAEAEQKLAASFLAGKLPTGQAVSVALPERPEPESPAEYRRRGKNFRKRLKIGAKAHRLLLKGKTEEAKKLLEAQE